MISRFIPASAGNGRRHVSTRRRMPVHPRERGERSGTPWNSRPGCGSSPRARGTAIGGVRNAMLNTVHPRERGERARGHQRERQFGGSSPRARGTVGVESRHYTGTRFIPASAGNGIWSAGEPSTISVHPRERGERLSVFRAALQEAGSSPRARGTAGSVRRSRRGRRFIPASAGNGRCSHRSRALPPVHPRERGERVNALLPPVCLTGSSPRARGTA